MQNTPKIKKVKYGKAERVSFAKIDENIKPPYLLEIQKDPYKEFLETGIGEILAEYSPIVDYSGKAEMYFMGYHIEEPKYSVEECRRKRLSYTAQLKVNVRLVITETGEAIDQEVFMGDMPIMTKDCCFIVNGVERRITSKEGKRMQGFPEDYQFPVSETIAMKQLGNSVAIPAIQAVGNKLIETLEHNKIL